MKIALLAPSDKSFIKDFLSNYKENDLPNGYSGAPFIGSIIKEMLKLNLSVCAITTTESENNDYTIREYTNGNFKWIVVPYRPNSIRPNGKKLGRIVDGFSYEINHMKQVVQLEKPNFVHAHWSYEFAGAAIKSGFPFLITVHDNPFIILKYFRNLYRLGRLVMAELNLKRTENATTVSPYMLSYLQKRCKNINVVPNPVEIVLGLNEVTTLIQKRVKSLNEPRIFMVNNGWDKRKNGNKALEAFKKIQLKYPKASLHLYGAGSEVDGPAHRAVKALNLNNVYLNGTIDRRRLLEELKTAHLFLHPALEESFGVVLIEAMSLGIPVIGGLNSGAVPWVINNNELLVEVSNAKEISDKILQIIGNETLYYEVSGKGYKNVSNRFAAKAVVREYYNIYKEILS